MRLDGAWRLTCRLDRKPETPAKPGFSPFTDINVVIAIVLAAVFAGLLLFAVTMLSTGNVGTTQPSAQSPAAGEQAPSPREKQEASNFIAASYIP